MIKANELRIGNLVMDEDSTVRLTDICANHVNHQQALNCPYEDLEPIPLTPKVLKKCGLRRNGDWMELQLSQRILIRFFNGNPYECDIVQDGKFIAFKSGHLKYLHQFQNLIFALTDEELEVKI